MDDGRLIHTVVAPSPSGYDAGVRWVVMLAIIAAASPLACKREKRHAGGAGAARGGDVPEREPRFMFRRKVEGVWRPFVESASGGDAIPVLSDLQGDLYSVAGLEQGSDTMFAIIRKKGEPIGELWRLTTQPVPRAAERYGTTSATMFGASADGGVILLLLESGKDEQTVQLVRKGDVEHATNVLVVRKSFTGDVSADGTHGVIAGIPVSCIESWIGKCPIHLWEIDFTTTPPTVTAVEAPETRASYSPRFVPGSNRTYGFESTTGDPDEATCAKGLNDCRHDLVERDFGGGRRVLRERALGPYYSQRGDLAVFLTMDDSGCARLPCDKLSMFIADRSADGQLGKPRLLVKADVFAVAPRWWSPDGRYLAYRAPGDGKTRPLRILSAEDPKQLSRAVDGEYPIGWLR